MHTHTCRLTMGAIAILITSGHLAHTAPPATPVAKPGIGGQHLDLLRRFTNANLDPAGRVATLLRQRGLGTFAKMPIMRPRDLSGAPFRPIGPAPLWVDNVANAGEVVGLAIDPRGRTSNVLYLATGDGGVWKSINAGRTWRPLTDGQLSQAIGAVALDPTNPDLVYAATGNPWQSLVQPERSGIGLYKSIDGGDTWTVLAGDVLGPSGTLPGKNVFRIAIAATNPRWILLATDQGLFRSIDGGEHFGNNPIPGNINGGFDNGQPILLGKVTDLAYDTGGALLPGQTTLPGSVGVVYAAVEGRGLLKSVDFGRSFPLNLFTDAAGRPKPDAYKAGEGYLSFAQSVARVGPGGTLVRDTKTLYVSAARAGNPFSNGFLGLFKSQDAGATWQRVHAGNYDQLGFNQAIGIDPQNPDLVYLGFRKIHRSTDGGRTFVDIGDGTVHPDQHSFVFPPASHFAALGATPLYAGNDGGLFVSGPRGESWRSLNEGGVQTSIVTHLRMGQSDPARVYAGLWDQGATARLSRLGPMGWFRGFQGDGGAVAVDPRNPRVSLQSGNYDLILSQDGGESYFWPGFTAPSVSRIFYAPTRTTGDGRVTDAALYYAVGSDLFGVSPLPWKMRTFGAGINELVVPRTTPDTAWISLFDGTVWRSDNFRKGTDASWRRVFMPPSSRRGAMTAWVAVSEAKPETAVVTLEGYSDAAPGTSSAHVFLTNNGGALWVDISGITPGTGVPDLPVYAAIVVDDPALPRDRNSPGIIIANEGGVLALRASPWSAPGTSLPSSLTWERLAPGMPIIRCPSITARIEDSGKLILRVGTFGRGVWEWEGRL